MNVCWISLGIEVSLPCKNADRDRTTCIQRVSCWGKKQSDCVHSLLYWRVWKGHLSAFPPLNKSQNRLDWTWWELSDTYGKVVQGETGMLEKYSWEGLQLLQKIRSVPEMLGVHIGWRRHEYELTISFPSCSLLRDLSDLSPNAAACKHFIAKQVNFVFWRFLPFWSRNTAVN